MKPLFAVLSAAAVALTAGPAAAGGYMKIPDIAGESQRAQYEDQIVIESVAYSLEGPTQASIGRGRTRARATFGNVVVEKAVDSSSPYLALASAQQKSFKDVTISMTRSGAAGAGHNYLTITLENATIAGVETMVEDNGASTETVQWSFEKINWKYVEQNDDHSSGTEHETEYDVAAGI